MAVLIDGRTTGQAEWIAAALKDSQRATLLGTSTAGQGAVMELVEVPNGVGAIRLTTGILFRRDGQPISVARPRTLEYLALTARLELDTEGKFVRPLRRNRRKGVAPHRLVEASRQIGVAVELLQEKLGATTTAT